MSQTQPEYGNHQIQVEFSELKKLKTLKKNCISEEYQFKSAEYVN